MEGGFVKLNVAEFKYSLNYNGGITITQTDLMSSFDMMPILHILNF